MVGRCSPRHGRPRRLLVAEEVTAPGSVGERLAAMLAEAAVPVKGVRLLNLGRKYITHGSVPQLRRLCGIDRNAIAANGEELVRGS